jgi:hypothetical protein
VIWPSPLVHSERSRLASAMFTMAMISSTVTLLPPLLSPVQGTGVSVGVAVAIAAGVFVGLGVGVRAAVGTGVAGRSWPTRAGRSGREPPK